MPATFISFSALEPALACLKNTLCESGTAIFVAPPGVGKTTRIPPSLSDAAWLSGKRILMLEPRRLAAVNAASYMARQLGEQPGESVGYSIRYERCLSKDTRIEVITEGILARRLQKDPELSDVGLVIFDEFHERNVHSDLGLALCRDSQLGLRDDLRLLVMSATLEAQTLSDRLNGCPVINVETRSHPVDIRYRAFRDHDKLIENTVQGVREALKSCDGDILVFLPGAYEIARCENLLQDLVGVEIMPLYGNLPFEKQQQIMSPGNSRRVVLATNIAETSLTIDGVSAVVDSGYERRPRFHHSSGLMRLETVRISRQSAEQRAGRAGRQGPGICWRLWSEGLHGSLVPAVSPEICRTDLSELVLELAGWGVSDPEQLLFLDPPPQGGIQSARKLLQRLGALHVDGKLSATGRSMLEIPAHPRHSRLLLAAEKLGKLPLACIVVAVLSEQEILRANARSGDDLAELLSSWPREQSRFPRTLRAVRFWHDYFGLGKLDADVLVSDSQSIGRLLSFAYPDRVAIKRPGSDREFTLAAGRGCFLSRESRFHAHQVIVVPEASESGGRQGRVRWACAVDMEQLCQDLSGLIEQRRTIEYDPAHKNVVAWRSRCLIEAPLVKARDVVAPEEYALGLCDAVRKLGLESLNWSASSSQLHSRLMLLARLFPGEWPEMSNQWLLEHLDRWLLPYLAGLNDVRGLKRLDPGDALLSMLTASQRKRLDKLAPERLQVPSGSRIKLDYCAGDKPVLAVKLQELFGCFTTPSIVEGHQTVMIHLLSPAGRPLQVTENLQHFWQEIYPEVRKEMRGRYPKHPWPEDPLKAMATRHTKKRRP